MRMRTYWSGYRSTLGDFTPSMKRLYIRLVFALRDLYSSSHGIRTDLEIKLASLLLFST